jgi:small redox-active disulfide protein 2
MDDLTQIRIGKHMTGIIGLKSALADAVVRCKGMADDQIASVLVQMLSKSNYIETRIKADYAQAFLREYKKHIGEPVAEMLADGVQIKVLGPGCPQCEHLEREVMSAMSETQITAGLEHVRDLAEIGRFGVMGSPALVIDGKVKSVGSVPARKQIKAWLAEAANETKS